MFVSALTTLTKFEEANPKPDSENAQISEKWYVELGVATYKTYKDMSDEMKKALPDVDDLRKLLISEEQE